MVVCRCRWRVVVCGSDAVVQSSVVAVLLVGVGCARQRALLAGGVVKERTKRTARAWPEQAMWTAWTVSGPRYVQLRLPKTGTWFLTRRGEAVPAAHGPFAGCGGTTGRACRHQMEGRSRESGKWQVSVVLLINGVDGAQPSGLLAG